MNARFKNLIFLAIILSTPIHSKVVTLFSHGIADTGQQVNIYRKTYRKNNITYYNEHYTIHTPFVSFNYPDATDRFYRVNYNETSFGQENEIARLYKAYQKTNEHFGNCDVILHGLSRGASDVIIFSGLYPNEKTKALILESPYFSLTDVIESIMKKKRCNWLPLSYGEALAEFIFKKYRRDGNTPASCIEAIALDMPIFIVCSQEDHLVPCSSTMKVYKKLIETGHKHTYIFITEQGKHAAILHGPDGEKYMWTINAFYKKYNLPHCAESAAKGESLLSLCQPELV